MTKKSLNLKEAARFLGISRQTAYNWVKKGKLRPIAHGERSWAFSEQHLEQIKGQA